MQFVPARHQGHLIGAAIRVLTHRGKRPPTSEEIAELLGLSREIVLHILRGLEERGIVRSVQTPFEVRISLEDYQKIEDLPEEAAGPDIGREIEDFHKKAEDRQKRIEKMMRESDPEQKTREKASRIEEEFQRFRAKREVSPFDAPEGEEKEE
jgi:DNA-binding transcriptional regulator GbsR (MarR family)